MNINNLPAPTVIEELDFSVIKDETLEAFKQKVPDYDLLESDPYSANIEANSYREMLIRARVNNAIKALLLPYATGDDLDNLAAFYLIDRIKGANPSATILLELVTPLSVDVTIPSNTIFRSSDGKIAILSESVIITAGNLSSLGTTKLQEFIKESDVKCELIQTPLPFVVNASQTTIFNGGALRESDEAFVERIILSLGRFSTAGSIEAYRYHAKTASVKVEEVMVDNAGAGMVRVIIKVSNDDISVINDVLNVLSGEKTRPLTDKVTVDMATKKIVNIEATVELTNMSMQSEIDTLIRSGKNRFSLGEDLNLSYIYKQLHQNGVYRVILTSPGADVKVEFDEFIEIDNLILEYKEAEL